jgi:hypothetical protein
MGGPTPPTSPPSWAQPTHQLARVVRNRAPWGSVPGNRATVTPWPAVAAWVVAMGAPLALTIRAGG